ncbi:MAG: hypothetical protein WBB37_04860 [bacterium]
MRFISVLITFICVAIGQQHSKPAGILTSVNGNISIIRVQTTITIQAHLLDYLFEGDTLVIKDSCSATIFFKNGALLTVDSNGRLVINSDGRDTSNLSIKKPVNQKKMSGLFDDICTLKHNYDEMITRDNVKSDDTIRCLIQYPGNTALINARPDVIWNKYPGANWYTMKIQQGSEIVSSIATTDTVFSYPQHDEDMLPGNYKIRVLAAHNSDTLGKTTRSLIILDSISVYDIHQTIEMIAKQKPDDFTFHLLKAVFFRKNVLRLMAIESFRELLAINPDSPILYKGLAELYYGLGILELGDAFLGLAKQTIITPQIKEQ